MFKKRVVFRTVCILFSLFVLVAIADDSLEETNPMAMSEIVFEYYEIIDSLGDDDGMIDPGESIELPVAVRNRGVDTAYSLTGTLRTTDPYVTLTDSMEEFGDVPPDSVSRCLDAFRFDVDAGCPSSHAIDFELVTIDALERISTNDFSIFVLISDIFISVDTLDFETAFIGYSDTLEFQVINTGSSTLEVNDISSDNPDYSVDITNFSLRPDGSRTVQVIFAPAFEGVSTGNLFIRSDGSDTSIVFLQGEGLVPPDISFYPDSLIDSLLAGETSTCSLSVYNMGGSDLSFYLSLEGEDSIYVLEFDGVDDYIEVPDHSSLSAIGEAFTLEFWIRVGEYPFQKREILGKWGKGSGVDDEYGGNIHTSGEIELNISGASGGLSRVYSNPISPYTWIHIAEVFNSASSSYSLFVNGNLDSSITPSTNTMNRDTDQPFRMGTYDFNYAPEFKGQLDEVRIWNVARTQTEIRTGLYRELSGFESGLVGYWKLNEGSGNIAYDSSPYNNDGTLHGGPTPVVSPAPVAWLSVTPTSDTVKSDSLEYVEVTFDARGLIGGDYNAYIVISSNDPDEPEVRIPVHLHVTGIPDIAVLEDTVDYGTVFAGYSSTDTLIIYNEGTDSLAISNISSDISDFSVDVTNFSLAPAENQEVIITFTPGATGNITGILTITSDDPDESPFEVYLEGECIEPPDISVSTGLLSDSLFIGETSIDTLTIYNTGSSDLIFDIPIEAAEATIIEEDSRIKVENAISSIIRRSQILEGEIRVNSVEATTGMSEEIVYKNPEEIANTKYASNLFHLTARPSIAVIAAAGGLSKLTDVQDKLLATEKFNSVSVIDAEVVTPSLAELQAFDAVIVWFNYQYLDKESFGNNLADYVDMGGGVVSAVFETTDYYSESLRGRWRREKYYVITGGGRKYGHSALGAIADTNHPTMDGVEEFDGGYRSYRPNSSGLTGGSTLIASWADGIPLVAVKKIGETKRVDLGFYPPSSDLGSDFWDVNTDGDLLMANALVWVVNDVDWLSVTPLLDTIPAGDSVEIEVNYSAMYLSIGDYFANLVVASNDPDEPEVRISVNLHVAGIPDITISDDTLDYGTRFVGASVTDTLIITNEGTDFLFISNISSDNTDFTVDITDFSLAPGSDQEILVTFAPSTTEVKTGTLTIESNDPDEPVETVFLQGEGAAAPVITVEPDYFSDTLTTGESGSHILTIGNTGENNLSFEIMYESIEGTGTLVALNKNQITLGVENKTESTNLLNQSVESQSDEKEFQSDKPEGGSLPTTGGYYAGDYLGFYISRYGEIITFEYPAGTEHLLIGNYLAGYTVCYNDGEDKVEWSSYEDRYGIETVSYTEILNDVDSAVIDIVTQTSDGKLTITQRFTFNKHDKFVRIGTNIENKSGTTLSNIVFKKWADWDMDGDYRDDSWDYDVTHNMIYAWDEHYGTIAAKTPPDYRDIEGWDDYNRRITDEDYINGPLTDFDGLEILHYELGSLSDGEGKVLTFAYGAGDNLIDLKSVVERGIAGVERLTVNPDTGTVLIGDSTEIEVIFNAASLYDGDYYANLLVSSNDPITPLDTVLCFMHVIGAPFISTSTDTLEFSADSTDTLELRVRNDGTDDLQVTNISSDNPDYSVDINNFILLPDGSQIVKVIFTQTSVESSNGNLTIQSNDPDKGTYTVALIGNNPSGVEENIPKVFSISANYPNPFCQATVIRYGCPKRTKVSIQVFDIMGRLVNTLVDKEMDAGYHEVRWDGSTKSGRKVASAVYFYRMQADDFKATGKMIFAK